MEHDSPKSSNDDLVPTAGGKSPPDPSTPAGGAAAVLDALGKVLGLFAALGTLVYLAGAGVVWLRLRHAKLPSEVVIAHLPREILISTGLVEVVLPALVAGAFYTLLILYPDRIWRFLQAIWRWRFAHFEESPAPARALVSPESASRAEQVGLYILAVLGLLLLPLPFYSPFGPPTFVALLFAVLTVIVFLSVGRLLASSFAGKLRSVSGIASAILLIGFTLGPWFVAYAELRHQLLPAFACHTDGTVTRGVLIGETSDRLYLGSDKGKVIDSIPLAQIQQVYLGGTGPCAPVPSSASKAVQGTG